MVTVAERLQPLTAGTTLSVCARRRRSLFGVAEGLEVRGPEIHLFEPVRRRRWWARRAGWTEVQPVQDAASRIGAHVRGGSAQP